MDKNYRKFLTIWIGEFISSIGSGLSSFALGVFVYNMTSTATSVSMVTLCAFLPSVLLAPFAGVLADRFDRRAIMILSDSLSAIGLIIMLLIMQFGDIQVWQICLCVFVSSIFVAGLDPAYKATITDLLPEDQFENASGMVQLASASKFLLAPVIAGFLLQITTIKVILLIDILTAVVTVCTTFSVKKTINNNISKPEESKFIKEFVDGCKYLASNKGVFILMILISVITYCMGFLETLFTPMLMSFSDAKTLGIVESVAAIGMVVSSFIIGVFSMSKNHIKNIVVGLCFAGIFIILIGLTTNIMVIIISAFLFFATLPFLNSSLEVLMRKSIPNETQGRVWGLVSFISQFGYVISYAISGVMADYIFNPLLKKGGLLENSLGRIFGVGETRGIGLLFFISGMLIICLAFVILRRKSIRKLSMA